MNALLQSSSFSKRTPLPVALTGSSSLPSKIDDVFRDVQDVARPVQPAPAEDDNLAQNLHRANALFKILVSRVSMHLGLGWLQKLFGQIDGLLDVDEWDPRDPAPNQDTIRTFIRLLLILRVQRKPGIGISNSGNIIAAWTVGTNRLTVECLAHDRLRWVVSRDIDGDVERAAGDGKIERLQDLLAPYNPSIWFEYAK